jgi:hypothetical protein
MIIFKSSAIPDCFFGDCSIDGSNNNENNSDWGKK